MCVVSIVTCIVSIVTRVVSIVTCVVHIHVVAIDNWLRHHVIDHMFSLLDIVIYCVPQLGNITS